MGAPKAVLVAVETSGLAGPGHDLSSRPDPPSRKFCDRGREVGVASGELVDPLGGQAEHGCHLGDTDQVEAHARSCSHRRPQPASISVYLARAAESIHPQLASSPRRVPISGMCHRLGDEVGLGRTVRSRRVGFLTVVRHGRSALAMSDT